MCKAEALKASSLQKKKILKKSIVNASHIIEEIKLAIQQDSEQSDKQPKVVHAENLPVML